MSTDPFEMFDASYVMGALSDADRDAFEAHLRGCGACTRRVEDLRELPALLALAPESAYLTALGASEPATGSAVRPVEPWAGATPPLTAVPTTVDPVPDTLLPRLLTRVARERNRRRLASFASIAVAAACIIAVCTVVLFDRRDSDPYRAPARAAAMANLLNVPIKAQAEVVTVDSWARVDMWCTYDEGARPAGDYLLVARSRTGTTLQLGAWPGVPGQTAVLRVPTRWHPSEIASIDITATNGKVLSRLTL